ncbi:MAG TPA: lysozyme inhibitor LprI family protein [Rhizomicrobium sp.]|nr:lysozyme inhibitor LprI family protein [Rhizomicrobium sp.]
MNTTARLFFISATLVLTLATVPASADCYTAGTASVRMQCQREFLLQADRYLNETYAALIGNVSEADKAGERSSQRQWLKERDQVCALAPGQTNRADWTTTILTESDKADCVIQETLARAQFMTFLLEQRGGQPPLLPHSKDGGLYSGRLKPGMSLDDYVKSLRGLYDGWDRNKNGVLSADDFSGNVFAWTGFVGNEVGPKDQVTWEQATTKGAAYFRYYDKDNDGVVSADEFNLVKEFGLALEVGAFYDDSPPDCELPKPAPGAQIVLLSAYETKALASVGMHGSEVRAGLVRIAPGEQPLYVLLSTFRPVIWTFEGAVERVQFAVLSSIETAPSSRNAKVRLTLAGAVGLKPSQVFIAPNSQCIQHFYAHPSDSSIRRIGSVRRQFGRLPDVVSASYSVAGFSVPDGALLQYDERGNALGWRNLRSQVGMFYPGGVVPIDASKVVSGHKVEAYSVLPGVAGLRQLVEQGALVPLEGHAIYRVTRKITIPAGLYGASLATFIVPSGVPLPEGDLGHSCAKSEDGKALAGICDRH